MSERIGMEASFVLVSNVLPYTPELQDEILYSLEPTSYEGQGDDRNPRWILPKMDWSWEMLKEYLGYSSEIMGEAKRKHSSR
jgi:hypothetical protein